ncbi:MAG: hypothetical protein IJU05_04365 [Schwartzia sp.]|nr:hypothetical protein [Schwartzia sp. (in: firmicutes)]
MTRIVFLWLAALWLGLAPVAQAKPFAQAGGPTILIGEVASYGDYALQPFFFETLRDLLTEKLQNSGRFRVETRWMPADPKGQEDPFSLVHMDAIVRGHQFRREMGGARIIRFADAALGRAYYSDEARLERWRRRPDEPYRLSPKAAEAARAIGVAHGADYLLFCDMYDVNIMLNRSLFNAPVEDTEWRAKEIMASMNFYLVDAGTGRVFEGHNSTEKRGQIIDIVIGRYGKGFTIEQLLHWVLDYQTERTVKKILGTGLKALGDKEREADGEAA